MKKYRYYVFLGALAICMGLTSCNEDDDAELGDPQDKIEGITKGTWIIEEVNLIDESNPSKPERNISDYYTSGTTRMEMDFKTDFTFEVIEGDGLNFFPVSGTWSFDDDYAPTMVILISDDGEVTEAPLAEPPLPRSEQLQIQFTKYFCQVDGESKPMLGYRLVYNRD